MPRFFDGARPGWTSPTVPIAGAVPVTVNEPAPRKQPSQDDKAQTPVRKTEGGRYTDEDYAKLKDAFG